MKELRLSNGMVTVVDDKDFSRLSEFSWNFRPHKGLGSGHACRTARKSEGRSKKTVYMHREVLLVPDGQKVDHINGNGLDNRRENLRVATTRQNNQNRRKSPGTSSRFKGVNWDSERQRWYAHIKTNGKMRSLGRYDSEEDAARAYNIAARQAFGEFAFLNEVP